MKRDANTQLIYGTLTAKLLTTCSVWLRVKHMRYAIRAFDATI